MTSSRYAPRLEWTQFVSTRKLCPVKKVAAAKFKQQCLSILDHLEPEGVVITKHGKPVARLLPFARSSAELIGALKGRIRIRGDISSTGLTWDATRGERD